MIIRYFVISFTETLGYNYKAMHKIVIFILMVLAAMYPVWGHRCSHDSFAHNQPKTFMNDLTDARLLQTAENGKYASHYSG